MGILDIVKNSQALAMESVPSGGSTYSALVYQIFEANPGKIFSGKLLLNLFKSQGLDIPNIGNILFQANKTGQLRRLKSGFYTLG